MAVYYIGTDTRLHFAWLPVPLWECNRSTAWYAQKTDKKVWLRHVFEVRTVHGGWVAYTHNNPD